MNAAAHLAGVTAPSAESDGGSGKGAETEGDPALRLRLRRLLAACLDYAERELNKVRRALTGYSAVIRKERSKTPGGVPWMMLVFWADSVTTAVHVSPKRRQCLGRPHTTITIAWTLAPHRATRPDPPPSLSTLSPLQGVNDGNTPLKVLLMLTGSRGHAACPSGLPEPGMTSSPAVAARSAVSRCCLGLLVRRG